MSSTLTEIRPLMSAEPVRVAILYAPNPRAPSDKIFLDALLSHLAPAVQLQRLKIWNCNQVNIGDDINSQVESELRGARLIVVLLTPRFLADHEPWLKLALAQRPRARVVPVLCKDVLIEGSPFAGVALLPGPQAIAKSRDRDSVWTFVAGKLLEVVAQLKAQPPAQASSSSAQDDSPVMQAPPQSTRIPMSARQSSASATEKLRVLFLGANPLNATPVDAVHELTQIEKKLKGKGVDVIPKWCVTISDLQEYLLEYRPHILHFSGHGTKSGKLVLEDGIGNGVELPRKPFAELFGLLNAQRSLKCVVLSACYTAEQAQAIAEHVPCVVGLAKTISHSTAAAFAAGFYCALIAGESFQTSFDLGRNQIKLLSARKTSLRLCVVMPDVDPTALWLTS